MKRQIRLGLACLVRETVDMRTPVDLYKRVRERISGLKRVVWEIVPNAIHTSNDARIAAIRLAQANLDAIVCVCEACPPSFFVSEILGRNDLPLLLWNPEEYSETREKTHLDSVQDPNSSTGFTRLGTKMCRSFSGTEVDATWVDAVRAISALRHAHIGVAGYRTQGFDQGRPREPGDYDRTGVLLDFYELSDLYQEKISPFDIAERKVQLMDLFDASGISANQEDKVAELSALIDSFCGRNGLDALSIHCWPEFALTYGIAPCASMSLLQAEGRILACEGDVEGALSMLMQVAVGGRTPYLFDFSRVDPDAESALLWHCGAAPCNLWDGKSSRRLAAYSASGRGVAADFVLAEGELSIARLDRTRGVQRLFLQKARALPTERSIEGTYVNAAFSRPVREVMDLILRNGVARHASMVYGDYIAPLREAANILGWTVLE